MQNNRSIRIRTNVGGNNNDNYVNVKLDNTFNVIELLSLKINTDNFYKVHTSDYGCIAGRVLANGGVGIPNAKISVFVGLSDRDANDPVISALYPHTQLFNSNNSTIRYNLLPDEQVSECHNPVGTFPSKRMVLDDDNVIEVFDKYYKYTTRSNDAGDYMIFGVPVGEQSVHVDIDLSDIGHLSQRPRDMIYKGYNITQFENANKFKKDTNLDTLTQIITQNNTVYVYPFWGNSDVNEIKITRNDIDVHYKFEPTCVFMGSIVTDEKTEGITGKCIPTSRMGKMDKLRTGIGTIEMIRKTVDDEVESVEIQGNQLIDGNGTWCYQIPMNLDYFITDEYGNFVPSDDREKGIPTRARVRFRVSMADYGSDYENNHLAKVLIPNNPKELSDMDYHFGSLTYDNEEGTRSFRDLFWNKVYTVKQYIPRIQKGNSINGKEFSGFKQVNANGSNNPIPYNNIRVSLGIVFMLQCAILKMLIRITAFINKMKIKSSDKKCTVLGDGVCPDLENWYFAPGCDKDHMGSTLDSIKSDDGADTKSIEYENNSKPSSQNYCITNKTDYLMQCVEINLAMEYEVINFDFYNDWINGMVYIPHWFVNYRKKRSYLFGLIRVPAKTRTCTESAFGESFKYLQMCALDYDTDKYGNYTRVVTPKGCNGGNKKNQECHKKSGRKYINIFGEKGGIVHEEQTLKNQTVYYFKPAEWEDGSNTRVVRCPLFATDIVLLGSMDSCDRDGIPQIYKELTSTTYQLPSNLATTNMDNQGFMYGWSDKGTTCTGRNAPRDTSVERLEQTFEEFNKWAKTSDVYSPNEDTLNETPMTEISGVDWGYSGPKQGDNDRDSLYFPGGHFLGIACFRAQTNIKSCVNLSRACEFGSMLSQRQSFLYRTTEDKPIYDHLIPNGLISKFEITDSDFRKVFATLNYNGLKTELVPETQYRKYKFTYLHPTNFNGELADVIMQDADKRSEKKNYFEELNNNGEKMYRFPIEEPSADYYNFRMGLSEFEEVDGLVKPSNKQKRYGNIEHSTRTTVSLPFYENSYYFYFGLKTGNTAIDRFFKDFYASCETVKEDEYYFTIKVNDGEEECSNTNSAEVTIINVEAPYYMELYIKDGYYDNLVGLELDSANGIVNASYINASVTPSVCHNLKKFTITGLKGGVYTLRMKANKFEFVESTFSVTEKLQPFVAAIEVTPQPFNEWVADDNVNPTNVDISKLRFSDVFDLSELVDDGSPLPYKQIDVSGAGIHTETNLKIVCYNENDLVSGGILTLKYNHGSDVVLTDDLEYGPPMYTTTHGNLVFLHFAFDQNVNRNDKIYVKIYEHFASTATGTVTISNVSKSINALLVTNDDKYVSIPKTDSLSVSIKNMISDYTRGKSELDLNILDNSSDPDTTMFEYVVPAWKGNDTYNVYAVYYCGGKYKARLIDSVFIEMPTITDIYIGDMDLTVKNIEMKLQDLGSGSLYNESWIETVLNSDVFTAKQKWNVMQALFYKHSYFEGKEYGNLIVGPIGDNISYQTISGNFETTSDKIGSMYITTRNDEGKVTYTYATKSVTYIDYDNTDLSERTLNSNSNLSIYKISNENEFKLDLSEFYLPTHTITDGNELTTNFGETHIRYNLKKTYGTYYSYGEAAITDRNIKSAYTYACTQLGASWQPHVFLPSIYHPCIISATYLVKDDIGSFIVKVKNLILYSGNTENVTYKTNISFNSRRSYLNHKNLLVYENKKNNQGNDVDISFTITEGCPDSMSENSVLLPETFKVSASCHFCSPSDGDDSFYYTEGIRFYYSNNDDDMDAYVDKIYYKTLSTTDLANRDVNQFGPSFNYYQLGDTTWNGIFGWGNHGDDTFRLIECTHYFTPSYLQNYTAEGATTLGQKFQKIINEKIGHNVIAVYDKWTRSTNYFFEDNDSDRNWNATYAFQDNYPDTHTICLVKYYKKTT